ncbi:Formamidopyrimidine-DNA glycosylase [Bienertia sinuspersici]
MKYYIKSVATCHQTARIHPSQNASSLSKGESAKLLKCIKEVILHAVEVDADSQQFPFDWLFHFRWGKKPGKVDGMKIDFITVAEGYVTSAYVPELQKLSGASKASPKARKQASKKNKVDDDDDDGNGNDDDEDVREEKMENVKSKHMKNSKSGKPPPKTKNSTKIDVDNNDETARTRGARASAKRKSQGMEDSNDANKSKNSRSGAKKAVVESESGNNHDSDASNDDGNKNGTKKQPTKAGAKKPQKPTKKKAKVG